MAGDGGIDRAEDRLRQIREDDGERERQHAAMPAHGDGERSRVIGEGKRRWALLYWAEAVLINQHPIRTA